MIVIGVLAVIGMVLISTAAVSAWRREHRRSRLLAERLLVEGHIERLTVQTLQAMRQAARDRLRSTR